MTSRIHYRLADDANNGHALWSGALTVEHRLSRAQARQVVAKHLGLKALPARTLVLSDHDLATGTWTAAEIRGETTRMADAPTVKRKKKAFADVGMTFDQAEDLLKKFGLKR